MEHRVERESGGVDSLEPQRFEFLPELPREQFHALVERLRGGDGGVAGEEPFHVVEFVEQAAGEGPLDAGGQFVPLLDGPLPEVVVLGGKPGIPVLQRVVLFLKAADGLRRRFERHAGVHAGSRRIRGLGGGVAPCHFVVSQLRVRWSVHTGN